MEGERVKQPERERKPYSLASRFKTLEEAAVPYYAAQETIRVEKDVELSAYRFMEQWDTEAEKPWYVIVVGDTPIDTVHEKLMKALSLGEIVEVPEDVIEMLLMRRAMEITKGSWVESHHKEGGLQMTQIKFSRKSKGKGHKHRKH